MHWLMEYTTESKNKTTQRWKQFNEKKQYFQKGLENLEILIQSNKPRSNSPILLNTWFKMDHWSKCKTQNYKLFRIKIKQKSHMG